MKIRVLEDIERFRFKKGELKTVPDFVGAELISKNLAVKVEEVSRGVDPNAYNALNDAKGKDEPTT